ncbi:hypothetical protein [Mariniblastus fucicola]|uniref:Secreted protein n=1 Tax=Mariniblastus fucicola TaxID=980251 RepID=A0A5B9PF61_9BACT|nr:hypothetical protein [Mariniblastus fucicola]QEG23522.1 hypothetical protein MFFC18_34220 [Mariniblastus fucicola]
MRIPSFLFFTVLFALFSNATAFGQLPIKPCLITEPVDCPADWAVFFCTDASCELLTQDPFSVLTEDNWNELNPNPTANCAVSHDRIPTFASYNELRPWMAALDTDAVGNITRYGLRNWDTHNVVCAYDFPCACEDGFDPLVGASCVVGDGDPDAMKNRTSGEIPIAPQICPETT